MYLRHNYLAISATLVGAVKALAVGSFNGNSDVAKSFDEICSQNGFAFEQHEVTTEDGYILTVYRIPGLVGQNSSGKPPVFMQHGVFDSAYAWVMNNPDVAPAFVAAKAGYDVWLGNSRGNTFSRKHTSLDPDTDGLEYWGTDWTDMGGKDLPAVFDYLLKETNNEKLAYIGHSQGTT